MNPPYQHNDPQRHPVVQAAVLHGDGHDEPAQKHVVGRVQVVDGHLACGHDAEQGEGNLDKLSPGHIFNFPTCNFFFIADLRSLQYIIKHQKSLATSLHIN